MTIDDAKSANPAKRRGLARLILGGIALGLIGVAADRLLLAPEPRPPLLAGLERDPAALPARVAARYPAGSAEAALRADLAVQGFAVGAGTAKWSRAAFPCRDFAEIGWTARAGRITATRASMFQACT